MGTRVPVYKLLQGRKPSIEAELQAQDVLFEQYDHYGIVNGTPGSASEADVRGMVAHVMGSSDTVEGKLDALEAIDVYATNNLANGHASDCIEEISKAWRDVFYSPPQSPQISADGFDTPSATQPPAKYLGGGNMDGGE